MAQNNVTTMILMPRIRANGIDLGYEDEGTGPVLVLLHGYPFNRTMWREQIDYLKASLRVIAPDLRGLGESSGDARGDGSPATMEVFANDAAALLDELGLERVILGGLSMGGYVAMAFCRSLPGRVRALILADTRSQADTEEARDNRERQAEKILKEGIESIVDGFLEKALCQETLRDKPAIVERVRTMIMSTRRDGAANALRGMAFRRDQTDLLSKLTVPVLIIVGSEDEITPPQDAIVMNRLIPDSRIEIINGAGHVSNIERPQEFNRALQRFIQTLR